jgi:hypothetical protein
MVNGPITRLCDVWVRVVTAKGGGGDGREGWQREECSPWLECPLVF